MFEHCSAEFQDWVSGEPGAVREFRRSVKARDPRCMLAPPFDVRDVCIPLRITVTGCLVAKVWCDPLTVLSFSSTLATPRNTEGVKFLSFGLTNTCKPSMRRHGVDTMQNLGDCHLVFPMAHAWNVAQHGPHWQPTDRVMGGQSWTPTVWPMRAPCVPDRSRPRRFV